MRLYKSRMLDIQHVEIRQLAPAQRERRFLDGKRAGHLCYEEGSMAVTRHTDVFSEQDWEHLKEGLGLPPRQAEILRCVLDGMSDKQIANTLGISFGTVRGHISRLFERFGSNDRVELIIRAFGYLRERHAQDDSAPR
jgi:DNA-binding NarL/FixJ family response regulator